MEDKDRELHAIRLDNEAVSFPICYAFLLLQSCDGVSLLIFIVGFVGLSDFRFFRQVWAKEDLLREQSKEIQSYRYFLAS